MSSYRITHVDAQRCRRVLLVVAKCNADAVEVAMRLYGDAWMVCAIRQQQKAA